MKLTLCGQVGLMGLFGIREVSKPMGRAAYIDRGAKAIFAALTNAKESELAVSARAALILHVHRAVHASEICNRVVEWVSVDMVYVT